MATIRKKEPQNRLVWVDVLRGIAIVLTVFGHSSVPVYKFIYAFHMPLFYMISGYLWNDNLSFKGCFYKSVKNYLVPYFTLGSINILFRTCYVVLKGESIIVLKDYIIGIIYSHPTSEYMPDWSALWFLTGFFCAVVIYKFIGVICKRDIFKNITICVVTLFGYVLSLLDIPQLFWNVDSSLVVLLFLHIGYLLKKHDVVNRINRFTLKNVIVGVVFICISMVTAYYNPVDYVSFGNHVYGDFLLFLTGSIPICLVLIGFIKLFSEKYEIKWFAYLGKHTLFIMGFDFFSQFLLFRLVELLRFDPMFFFTNQKIGWLLLFIGKMVILSIGLFVWTFVVNKIPNTQIKKYLNF